MQSDSDTSMTLKQGQGNQIWYESVDLMPNYNHAKSERLHLHSVEEEPTLKFLQNQEQINYLSWIHANIKKQ